MAKRSRGAPEPGASGAATGRWRRPTPESIKPYPALRWEQSRSDEPALGNALRDVSLDLGHEDPSASGPSHRACTTFQDGCSAPRSSAGRRGKFIRPNAPTQYEFGVAGVPARTHRADCLRYTRWSSFHYTDAQRGELAGRRSGSGRHQRVCQCLRSGIVAGGSLRRQRDSPITQRRR